MSSVYYGYNASDIKSDCFLFIFFEATLLTDCYILLICWDYLIEEILPLRPWTKEDRFLFSLSFGDTVYADFPSYDNYGGEIAYLFTFLGTKLSIEILGTSYILYSMIAEFLVI